MLDSFKVKNFRLFRDLEIPRLGRVNLIVGKNNSGKSALLEALELYASNASNDTIESILQNRNEFWKETSHTFSVKYDKNSLDRNFSIRHLFWGHKHASLEESGIQIGTEYQTPKSINLYVATYGRILNTEGEIALKLLSERETTNQDIDKEYYLVCSDKKTVRRIVRLGQDISKNGSNSYIQPIFEVNFPYQSVPTQNMDARKVARLWDSIGLTELSDEVIEGLSLIEPNISGLLFVGTWDTPDEARIPLVSLEGYSEPFPLKSMGDGMTRIFHIILALVSAKNGILLIDEFENGLHWSVQPKVWKTVFRLAQKLNVQVFATTHSRDCISSFEEAWKENIEDGGFHRLQLDKNGEVEAKSYNLETLSDSLETDVEVR